MYDIRDLGLEDEKVHNLISFLFAKYIFIYNCVCVCGACMHTTEAM